MCVTFEMGLACVCGIGNGFSLRLYTEALLIRQKVVLKANQDTKLQDLNTLYIEISCLVRNICGLYTNQSHY